VRSLNSRSCGGARVALREGVGNNLPAVSGLIQSREQIAVSGTIVVETREPPVMGRRYPRAHLQPIAIEKR
jgi:hypothetical protein